MAQAAPPSTPYGAPISIAAARTGHGRGRSRGHPEQLGRRHRHRRFRRQSRDAASARQRAASSVRIAEQKARTAAEFRRPTKVFEDAVAGGGVGLRVLTFGASVAEGGVPIVSGGKVIGAIGVSGVQSHQDAQVAQAGADALK